MLKFKSTLCALALAGSAFALPSLVAAAPEAATTAATTVSSSQAKHDATGHKFHRGDTFKKLNLTEAQRDKMFEIRHQQAPQLRLLGKDVRAARIELRSLSQADTFDEAKAKVAAEKLAKATGELALLKAHSQSEIYSLLTPEQRKTMAEAPKGHHKGHRKGHSKQNQQVNS